MRPDECLGKDVVTPEGETVGFVRDVTVFGFSTVKQLLVETRSGLVSVDGGLVERVDAERILLKRAPDLTM